MISESTKAALTKFATRSGLGKAIPLILANAQECAYFTAAKRAKGSDLEPGSSRLGGEPDLPQDAKWPTYMNEKGKNQPASFLAQFNLKDVPQIAGFDLNRKGHLWLFRCPEDNSAGSIAAIFRSEPTKLVAFPSPVASREHATSLRFEKGVSLPMSRASFIDEVRQLVGNDDDVRKLEKTPDGRLGWIGGHPFPIEHDLYRLTAFQQLGKPKAFWTDHWKTMEEYEAAPANMPFIQSPGFDRWESRWKAQRPLMEWKCKHRAEIDAEAARWKVLASFGRGAFGIGAVEIGDAMSLDIFIRSSDLAAQTFDQLVAQCFPVL